MEPLRVRKLADKSPEAVAAHPASHPDKYPSLGIDIVDTFGKSVAPPKTCRVSTGWVDKLRAAGLVTLENEQVQHRPGGPPDDLWRVTHTFKHADAIVLKTQEGQPDLRYRVTHQPDKYVDTTDYSKGGEKASERLGSRKEADTVKVTDEHYAAGQTRVDHFYDLKLEG